MTKKVKKSAYLHHELGVYNGMSFKLVVPSKYNKENYPNYFIQYDGSIKHYTGIKVLYNKFLELTEELQTVQQLFELFIPKIKNEILPSLIEKDSIEDLTRLNDLVTTAINKYFEQQERLFDIGELVDISDYRDRNKKLNDYFAIHLNGKLKLSELNKDVWHKFDSGFTRCDAGNLSNVLLVYDPSIELYRRIVLTNNGERDLINQSQYTKAIIEALGKI